MVYFVLKKCVHDNIRLAICIEHKNKKKICSCIQYKHSVERFLSKQETGLNKIFLYSSFNHLLWFYI